MNKTAVTTTRSEEAEGQTTIDVTDASVFSVGDLVNFGETDGHEYEVTSVNDSGSSDTIVIKLKDDVNGDWSTKHNHKWNKHSKKMEVL